MATMNKNIRLIALDLDGTLLDSEKHVSNSNRKALEKAIDNGIHVVIASGRPYCALPDELTHMRGIEYAITSNGSSIFRTSDRKRVYAEDIPSEGVKRMLSDVIKNADFAYEACIAGNCYTMKEYFDDPAAFGLPERIRSYVQKTRIPVSDVCKLIEEHCQEIEAINFMIADQACKSRIRRQIMEIGGIYATSSASYYLEMAAQTVNKAATLDQLVHMLGLNSEQTAAFGDSINDIEMIRYAGTGVAMGNSEPEILSAADVVTLTNDEDGVAHFLETLF